MNTLALFSALVQSLRAKQMGYFAQSGLDH